MNSVVFQGGNSAAGRLVRSILASVTGDAQSEAARAVFIAIGTTMLGLIHEDFITKARGGTGADGTRWPRLSPKTLAYSRRFGPGEQAALKRAAGLGRSNRFAPGKNKGLLSAAELKQWRAIYASRLARFAASVPLGEAKAKAAAIAWAEMKRRGAKTKLEVYGNREHEILRDTGVLANSLSIGASSDSQVFDLLENGVRVGTKVAYAARHHYGGKGVPARPIMPDPNKIPQQWRMDILNAGMRTLASALASSLQRGAV